MNRILLLLAACVLLFGCGKGGGGGGDGGGAPGDVAKRYVTTLTKGDADGALKCIDPAKREMARAMIPMGVAVASGFAKSEGGLDSVSILHVEEQGNVALVGYQTKTKQGMERRDNLRTEKVNGTWYVAP